LIRKRRMPADDERILEIVRTELLPYTRRSFPQATVSRPELSKRLAPGVTLVEAGRDGMPVAFLHMFARNADLWVTMLGVERNRQGTGIGTRLMQRALRYGAVHGCTRCLLYVDESNGKAQGFYSKLGFTADHYAPQLRCWLMSRACP
jgi:ribosomal protein S18 acetylase RimI-like enzyme